MKEQLQLILKRLEAQLKQAQMSNDSLSKELKRIQQEKDVYKNSLSFKVGSFITFPFRFVQSFFVPKPKENPIKVSIDSVVFANDLLDVTGWAVSESNIKEVLVYFENDLIGQTNIGVFREDVMRSFPQNLKAKTSGFQLSIQSEDLTAEVIDIVVSDEEGFEVKLQKVVFPSTEDMSLNSQYQIFLQQNPFPVFEDCKERLSELAYQPLISVVVPVYNTNPEWLNACIESVLYQFYSNWELCLYDDASTSQETLECLKSWVDKDSRIKVRFGEKNQNISLASNHAIEMAQGEFVGLLDHDDELTANALFEVVSCLNIDKKLDFIYSDEDKIEPDGSFSDPHFKSGFNPDALLCQNYICHFSVIRKSLGDSVGWFRAGYEGSQDFDLFLRIAAITQRFQHIPKVLYHWRKVEGSTAQDVHQKDYAINASKVALEDYCFQQKIDARVESGLFPNSFRVKRLVSDEPLISIIVPFRDEFELLKQCVEGVLNETDYKNIELLLVNNQSQDSKLLAYLNEIDKADKRVRVLNFDEEFNYSKLNNWAVKHAKADYVLFLNNDIEVTKTDWLRSMVEHITREKIAAVGAKLLYADGAIQHSGLVVNENTAMHLNKGLLPTEQAYFERPHYIQNTSACTAACLLVKKPEFLQVGGFDEELFKIAYNDVDLCLKFRELGRLVVYTPYAELIHHESKTRGLDIEPEKLERFTQELKNYQSKWGEKYKAGDPYFNPNLLPSSEKVSLNIK